MSDRVEQAIATAVRQAITNRELVSWRYEISSVDNLTFQIKVWAEEGQPPRYFNVKVSESM